MNKTQIFKDYKEFFNREDKEINGVSPDFAEEAMGHIKECARKEKLAKD